MGEIARCFRQKFPYSLFVYPCLPCVGETRAVWVTGAAVAPLIIYFGLKLWYRGDAVWSDYINRDNWVPVYFSIFSALTVSIILALAVYTRKSRQKRRDLIGITVNALGVGVLVFLGNMASLTVYELTEYLPVVGNLVTKITDIIEQWAGSNAPKILVSWWGVAFGWLLMVIPIIGPFISALLTLVPQHLVIWYLGYAVMCSAYT